MAEQYNCFAKNKVCEFIILFIRQFFDIGYSSGSIIFQAVDFIRTFQRLTAPKTFTAKFSSECLEMFEWASKIIQKITVHLSDGAPLLDFEVFLIYAFALPISILNFITRVQTPFFVFHIWIYGLAIMLGCGIGFCQTNLTNTLALVITSVILGVLTYLFIRSELAFSMLSCMNKQKSPVENENENIDDEKENSENDDNNDAYVANEILIPFTLGIIIGMLLFLAIISNILYPRPLLGRTLSIIFSVVILVVLLFEVINKCCSKNYQLISKMLLGKLLFLFTNLFSILIIPCTNSFGLVMLGELKNQWQCIIGYIVIGLILPIGLNFLLIYYDYPDICDKYKKLENGNNYYKYIELADIVRQVAYAIASLFDCSWACIAIEIAWCIFIIAVRPYNNLSDYFLNVGNSAIIFIGNIITISLSNSDNYFSFGAAIGFFISACIPAIIAMYLFFFLEFQTKLDPCIFKLSKIPDNELEPELVEIKNKYIGESFDKLSTVFKIVTPIVWFIFSLNIPIIEKYKVIYKE